MPALIIFVFPKRGDTEMGPRGRSRQRDAVARAVAVIEAARPQGFPRKRIQYKPYRILGKDPTSIQLALQHGREARFSSSVGVPKCMVRVASVVPVNTGRPSPLGVGWRSSRASRTATRIKAVAFHACYGWK